jgi:hypothetical protein
MNFEVDSKILLGALVDIMGSGKYANSGGVQSNILSQYCYLTLEGNTLNLWNSDDSYINNITLEVVGSVNGNVTLDIKAVTPFLKQVKDTMAIAVEYSICFATDDSTLTLGIMAEHPYMAGITRIMEMDLTGEMPSFNDTPFEGSFTITSEDFTNAITMCELIKTGVYTVRFTQGELELSSSETGLRSYSKTIDLVESSGECATVQYTGPLHRFFKEDVTFYVKDNFPLYLVSNGRRLIKAPYLV